MVMQSAVIMGSVSSRCPDLAHGLVILTEIVLH